MKTKYIILINLYIIFSSLCNAQLRTGKIIQQNSDIKISINLSEKYSVISNTKGTNINFYDAVDVSKPGSPSLPSKIVYIAIPPQSRANVYLNKQQYNTYQDINVQVNPKVVKQNDSTLKYENQTLKREYFQTDQYPSVECQLIGYTWIRDYYCAIIRINPAMYNWKLKQVKLLLSSDLNISYNPVDAYPINNTVEAPFDSVLKKIILNYDYAKNFRSFRKFFSAQDSTGNWIDYSKEYVKLAIPSDGIYHIGYQDLINYGLNPFSIDPSSIKIFCKGKELPLFIKSDQSGSFTQNDYIEFWAEKNYGSPNYRQIVPTGTDYLNYMDRYTDTTFIWFTWNSQDGHRVKIDSASNSTIADTLTSYLNFQHFENDVRLWYYDSEVPRVQLTYWQENKVWTWQFFGTNGTLSIPFQASNVIPNSKIKTYVRLISNGTDLESGLKSGKGAHKVGVGLNTRAIMDSITFDYKQTVNLFDSTFSSGLIKTGANTLYITGLPTDYNFQQILLDWVDIEYYRALNAISDSLYFKFPDTLSSKLRVIMVTNLTLPDTSYILYKIKPDTIKYENFKISGTTNKTLTFVDTVSGGDTYILISKDYIKSPIFEGRKQFVNLRNNMQGADDIIISNKVLLKSAADYNNFIKSNYNVRTDLAFVDDIYDEFSFGYPEPEAIRNFLLYANKNWAAPKPSYLTLVGDANYDYKNLQTPVPAVKKLDLVPSYGDPVSDAWYSMWDSNQAYIPQMFVGRIPAANDQQVYFYLNKYQKYLARPFDDWNKTFLFFSGGDPTVPGQIDQLKSENDYIFNSLILPKPIGGEGYHFYKTINPATNFGPYTQSQIQNAIDNGSLFISYIGHSGTQTWDNGITDVEDLKNAYTDRFPLISDFGCSTGKFAEPDISSFGELFLSGSNNGQAICYLSNSSWGYVSTAVSYPFYFYEQFLRDSIQNVAEAHLLAKIKLFQQSGYSDVNKVFDYSNILFGDPLVDLKLPAKPNLKISAGDIQLSKDNPSDQDNYLPVKIYYHNLGLVPDDSLTINVKDSYNNKTIFDQNFKVRIPLFIDSLTAIIPIKNKVGTHSLTVTLDSANMIDEIYENDNQASINFNVYSITFRSLFNNQYYNSFNGSISFLNPSYNSDTANSKFLFQVDTTRYFYTPIQYEKNLGIFSSSIAVTGLVPLKKYWWRVKGTNSSSWSEPNSFTNINSDYNWYLRSPTDSLYDMDYIDTHYNTKDSSWELSYNKDELKISSAGSSDGKFASMQYDSLEQLPSTYFWGVATAIIDTINLRPYNFKTFVYPNPPSGDSLLSYLRSLPQGTVLAMAISDDGAQSVLGYTGGTPVRNEIKNWGSKYIDSVRYRESWCIIGKKGAAIGTVPEVYKQQFQGIAIIDTSLTVKSDSGIVAFPIIKNSIGWDSLQIDANIPAGASLKIIPLGIKSDNSIDTLSSLGINNGLASLNNINANIYPEIKLLARLSANQSKSSPQIKSLAVKIKSPPELGTNYQVVSLPNDSVLAGSNINLQFYVYNVGLAPADSFNVLVDVINSDYSIDKIYEGVVDTLSPGGKKLFNINYAPINTGIKSFAIIIDPDNKVREIYKDNNSYNFPFKVYIDSVTLVKTASISVTFDGNSIFNGDYVSPSPNIKFILDYGFQYPYSDTTKLNFKLDGKNIYYSQMDSIVYDTISRQVFFKTHPHLADGEHILTMDGEGLINQPQDLKKIFFVSNELKILNLYNYPNPFKSSTYFTFNLTQIPDQMNIKIFTIAGRLIRDIIIPPTALRNNFNKIYWDGRDEDGDLMANGVYLYKIIAKLADKTYSDIQKLAIVR